MRTKGGVMFFEGRGNFGPDSKHCCVGTISLQSLIKMAST